METVAPPENQIEPYRWRWAGLFVVLAAEVMDLVDSTIINIGAPSIRKDIGGSATSIQWFAAAYTLTFAIGLLTGGRLGDIFGRKRMFTIGSIGFVLASVACSISQNPAELITSRSLQGLMAAMLLPQGLGMIRTMFVGPETSKAFTMFGPVMGLSAVLGPVIAGLLINADLFGTGWRALFWINVPLGLFAIIGSIKFLPESRSPHPVRLDVLGVFYAALGMFLLVFPLVEGRQYGWPLWSYALLIASVPVFGLFAWHELRVERAGKSPLVMTSLFHERAFNAGLLFGAVFFAVIAGSMLCLGLFMQLGLNYSPLRAGITTVPLSVGLSIGATIAGILSAKFGRKFLHLGTSIMPLGFLLLIGTLSRYGDGVQSWQFIPSLLVAGFGMGLVFAPFFNIVLAGVTESEMGSAAGAINAIQQFGGALGVAVVATLFFSQVTTQAKSHSSIASAFTSAMQHTLWLPIVMALISFATAFLLPKMGRSEDEWG